MQICKVQNFDKYNKINFSSFCLKAPSNNSNVSFESEKLNCPLGSQFYNNIKHSFNGVKYNSQVQNTILKSREERYLDSIYTTWYEGSDRIIYAQEDGPESLSEQIEIIMDETSQPFKLVYTKKSGFLEGAYDKSEFILSDYPQEIDIIKAIKKGRIKGRVVNSTNYDTQSQTITFLQNTNLNNVTTSRKFEQNVNNEDYNYEYLIRDSNDVVFLDLKRSYFRISPNETITTIGKHIFKAKYNNVDFTIEILDNSLNEYLLDLKKLTKNQEDLKYFWDFLKDVPADLLIIISKYIDVIEYNYESIAEIKDKKLLLNPSIQALAHELGHFVECRFIENFSEDKNLIEIYNLEFNDFKAKYPPRIQKVLKYFSQVDSDKRVGLEELIAETLVLLTTYGNEDELSSRAYFLCENFPKTISLIATKFGYNYLN